MGLEHVSFVELYSGLQKQFPVLLLEGGLAVMLFSSLDGQRSISWISHAADDMLAFSLRAEKVEIHCGDRWRLWSLETTSRLVLP